MTVVTGLTDQTDGERRLVAAFRALNPRSRASSILKHGRASRFHPCILCDETGPSPEEWCNWSCAHHLSHLVDVEAELIALDAKHLGRAVEIRRLSTADLMLPLAHSWTGFCHLWAWLGFRVIYCCKPPRHLHIRRQRRRKRS